MVAALVGLLIGTAGVGGVLMVAYLALFAGLSIHEAAATALFSFLFTGLLGTLLYNQRRSIAWHITVPVCLGGMAFGFFGARTAAAIDAQPLGAIIGLIVAGAGLYIFAPRPVAVPYRHGHGRRERLLLLSIGAASGFGSGFSGAGGPVFSVPLMLIWRYMPLTAVATSQVLQIFAAGSGSLENFRHGFIDWRAAAVIILFELAGVVAGVRLAHAASALALRRLAGILCIASGAFLVARAL